MSPLTAEQIDAVLPQTQCGDCGYGGCMPYAKAMASGTADINLCPPGGTRVLHKLAALFDKEANHYQLAAKPLQVAFVVEDLCIGCTKCIQACPVDAISGAAKLMHTVISSECTGCNLCVDPCPMDCIEMRIVENKFSDQELQMKADQARSRFEFRNIRLARDQLSGKNIPTAADAKKAAIAAAVARTKAKRVANDTPKSP